ncbi:MAG: type I glyceraldehyde-3-phosphate dehydrogenase [Rickettsiales bacterium]|nr:type I glyceraldehyde-3-phosphate dehydrogenase [Rickettsiales bacterium]
MTLRVGINGLGRIGRCVARAIYETNAKDIELVAVNGPAAIDTHVHLLKYDSVHGRFPFDVSADGDDLIISGKKVKLTREKDPTKLGWDKLGVDLVLECTGKFNKKADAAQHLASGAKRVLISAPADEVDATIVYGVNNQALKKEHQVASVGSCTTNGLAPVVKVLHEAIGIEAGFMTTIHSYTGDQNIVDGSHKDLRRARAAALSMIPTSTGAAKTIGLIIPELKGKLDGVSIRVPTPNVSMIDLTFTAARDTSKDEINKALTIAAQGALKGVLDVSTAPLVSIDYTHTTASSTADLTGTYVTGGRLCRVAAWYDNEWAFSCRMLDVARLWTSLT